MLIECFAMIILYVPCILIAWSPAYTFSATSSALIYVTRNSLPALDQNNTENQVFVTIFRLLAVVLLSLVLLI